jgi:hypothetical protein
VRALRVAPPLATLAPGPSSRTGGHPGLGCCLRPLLS